MASIWLLANNVTILVNVGFSEYNGTSPNVYFIVIKIFSQQLQRPTNLPIKSISRSNGAYVSAVREVHSRSILGGKAEKPGRFKSVEMGWLVYEQAGSR